MPLPFLIISSSFDKYCKDGAFVLRNSPALPGIQTSEWEPFWALYDRRVPEYA